jgi:type IV pilus assembly protein PilM
MAYSVIKQLDSNEIIGEACREIIPNAAKVNLLPEGVQKANEFARKKPILLAAAACIALAPLPVFMAFQQTNAAYSAHIRQIEADIAPLESNQAAIRQNREQAESAVQSIQRVEGLVNSKANWIQFFAELQQSLYDARDVWLDQLKVVREWPEGGAPSYEVQVKGQMLVREAADGSVRVDQEALSGRIKGLQSSFEKSQFVVFSKSPVVTWTSLRDGLNVLPFSINLVVDTTKPL